MLSRKRRSLIDGSVVAVNINLTRYFSRYSFDGVVSCVAVGGNSDTVIRVSHLSIF